MGSKFGIKILFSLLATGFLIFVIAGDASPKKADYRLVADESAKYLAANGTKLGFENAVTVAEKSGLTVTECHALMHSVGHAAITTFGFAATAQEFPQSADACTAGFIHGALEEYFLSSADPMKETKAACDALEKKKPELYERCVHGIGHGLLISTDYNLPKALALCKSGIPEHPDFCTNGVFMENFDANQEPDHKDYYIQHSDPAYPCPDQAKEDKASCYFYAVDNFLNIQPRAYGALMSWCLSVEDGYRAKCIDRASERIIRDNMVAPARDAAYCVNLPAEYQKGCMSHMAFSYGYALGGISDSMRFCNELIDPRHQLLCAP